MSFLFARKQERSSSNNFSLTCGNNCNIHFTQLDPKDFPVDVTDDKDLATHRYVSLVAKSNDSDVTTNKEAKVLVSFLDGIVLLQTDKPIYTPQQSSSLEYAKGETDIIFSFAQLPNGWIFLSYI